MLKDSKYLKPENKATLDILDSIECNLLRNDFIESTMIMNDIPSIAQMKKEIINEYKARLLHYYQEEKNNFILECIDFNKHEEERKNDIPLTDQEKKTRVKDFINEIATYKRVNIIDSDLFVSSKLGSDFKKAVLWSGDTRLFLEKYINIFASARVVERTNRIRLFSSEDDDKTISLMILSTEDQRNKINTIIREIKKKEVK